MVGRWSVGGGGVLIEREREREMGLIRVRGSRGERE